MGGIFGSNQEPSSKELEDYVDLDEAIPEEGIREGAAELYVKAAELNSLKEVSKIKEEVYSGNVLLLDISALEDDLERERAVEDLRKTTDDIDGDIAAVKLWDDLVIVTPTSIKIERQKLSPEA